MELRPQRATVTFDATQFAAALAQYRKAVAGGDKDGDLDMRTGFDVVVDGTRYHGGMQMVACDQHGEPGSILVCLFADNHMPVGGEERFVILTRDHDTDEGTWVTGNDVFWGDARAFPNVNWMLRRV